MVSRMARDASTASPRGSAGRLVQVDLRAALPVERPVSVTGHGVVLRGVHQEQPGAAVRATRR